MTQIAGLYFAICVTAAIVSFIAGMVRSEEYGMLDKWSHRLHVTGFVAMFLSLLAIPLEILFGGR